MLTSGTDVVIHQTLGGSYTVQTDFGLFRIDGKDADAIGESVVDNSVQAATLTDGAPDPEAIWGQLRQVFDPEIPVNIVDLGLVYSMDVEKTPGTHAARLQRQRRDDADRARLWHGSRDRRGCQRQNSPRARRDRGRRAHHVGTSLESADDFRRR